MCKVLVNLVLFLTFGFYFLFAQIGLNTFSDSLKYSLYNYNSLRMRDSAFITIEYPTPQPFLIDPRNYTPSSNPFIYDNRSSSYYVPRPIRDELNLIMNRPKTADSMVPIIAIPLIAAQIAAKYIWVQEKSKIKKDNILDGAEGFDLLHLLWQESPLTISKIKQNGEGAEIEEYEVLERRMQMLVDNKLVKMRKSKNSETRYYPAKTRQELAEIVRTILNDDTTTAEESATLLSIIQHLE
jgi:hypothetical protein